VSAIDDVLVAFVNNVTKTVVKAFVTTIGGYISASLPKGSYKLIVAKKGYRVYEEDFYISESITKVVKLEKEVLIGKMGLPFPTLGMYVPQNKSYFGMLFFDSMKEGIFIYSFYY